MTFTFDGLNKLIVCDTGVTQFSASEVYSRWKEWTTIGDNLKFEQAFQNSIGGNPLGGGVLLGAYYFLTNGWKIRPQEADHTLIIEGNLFPFPDTAGLFVNTLGSFNVIIALRTSSLTQQVLISETNSLTASGIADAVWSEDLSTQQQLNTAGDIIKKTKTISTLNLGA
jgi:hypothetical protein